MRAFGTNRFSGIGYAPGPEAGEWPSPWARVTSCNQMPERGRPESYSLGRCLAAGLGSWRCCMNKFWPAPLPHPRALTDRWRTSLAFPGRSSDARRCPRRVLRRPAALDCEPDAHPQRSTCPGRRHAPRGPAAGRQTRSSTRRRPISLTFLIVRSRALDRGPRRDTVAGVAGGTTTCAARAPADSSKATVAYAASAVTRAMSPTTASIQIGASRGVIDLRVGQGVGDDHTRPVDAEMSRLPAAPSPASMLHRGPCTVAHDRSVRGGRR